MAFGIYNANQILVGDGVDTNILRREQLEDGTTFDVVLAEAQAAVAGFNASVDPIAAGLCQLVTDRLVYAPQGSMVFSTASYTSRPLPQGVTSQGWMLQLVQRDLGVRMNWDFLRRANMQLVSDTIREVISAAQDAVQYEVLNRFFDSDEVAVESGYSPGLASGAGTVTFTPPKYSGTTFASSHSHYNAANGWDNAAAANRDDLDEHGIAAPYVHLASSADRATIEAETYFFPAEKRPVVLQTDENRATGYEYRPLGENVIGWCYDGAVIPHPRIPTTYIGTWKPDVRQFGPTNPLAIMMTRPGMGALMVRPDLDFLADGIVFRLEFYVGIKNRIGGAAAKNTAGAWSDPTINL